MNKLLSLVKLELEDSFNKSSKKNYGLKTLIILYLLVMVILSAFINYLFYSVFKLSPYSYLYPLFLAIGVITLTFFSSIYRVKATLFSPKDKEVLTPLPLKKSSIVSAKILLTFLEELLFSLIIYLPCVVLYSIDDLSFIFYGLVLILTLPLFSLLLAFIIGFGLQILTIRLPWLRYVGTFFYIIFILAVCFLSMFANNYDYSSASENLSSLENIYKIFPFNVIYEGFLCHNMWYFIGYVGVAIAFTALIIFLYAAFYDKLYEAMEYVGKKPKFTLNNIRSSKISYALMKNDFKRLANNQMFLISAIMPGLLVLIVGISFYYSLQSSFKNPASEEDLLAMQLVYNMFPFIIMFFLGLASYTSFSVTLEGKCFYIYKTLPIKESVYIRVRLIENQLIIGTLTLISSIVMALLYKLDILGIVFVIIAPQLYIFVIGVIGLCFNFKYPRLVWSDYRQVKNMISNTLTMLVGLLTGIILVVVGIVLLIFVGDLVAYLSVLGIVVVLFIASCVMMKTLAPKLLRKIEV